MKQVVQNFRTGELKLEQLPTPALRPGGLLVRTAYSLISAGTERAIVQTAQSSILGKARSRPDLVRQVFDSARKEGIRATFEKVRSRLNQIKPLGYSASGTVIGVGKGVSEFHVGDRVACAGAGYASHAEVISVPKNLCCKLPEGASLEAASYTTVGSIALHSVRQAEAKLGESVAVVGLGLVGQLVVQILKAAGCRVLGIDISVAACELGKKSGGDSVATNPAAAREATASMTSGRGVDAIIVTAATNSSEPLQLAAELARDRARIVVVGLVGMDLPRQLFYEKELELRLSRSYGPGRYDAEYEERGIDYPIGYVRWTENRNMESFLRLVADRKIDTDILTSHRFPVDEAEKAYDLILNKEGERYCGIVLSYPTEGGELVKTVPTGKPRSKVSGGLGISLIGAGNFARGVLLPAIERLGDPELIGVSTSTGISAKNTAEQFGFSYATTDYRRLLDDENTRCVFIATRHDSHAELATEALRRGLAVFVEKPLATTEEELQEVVRAAEESGSLLLVGYNRRFAPLARQTKELLARRSGPLTVNYRINAGQLPAGHWALDPVEGGGRIIGEVCHFVDFIQYLTDSAPIRVFAESVACEPGGRFVDDGTTVSLRLDDGSVGTIAYTASGDPLLPKEQIEIFWDRSVAIIDDFKSARFIRDGKQRKSGGGAQDKGHSEEIRLFLEAVRSGEASPIALDSLALTSLACFGAVSSAAQNMPVDVTAALRTLFNR